MHWIGRRVGRVRRVRRIFNGWGQQSSRRCGDTPPYQMHRTIHLGVGIDRDGPFWYYTRS